MFLFDQINESESKSESDRGSETQFQVTENVSIIPRSSRG